MQKKYEIDKWGVYFLGINLCIFKTFAAMPQFFAESSGSAQALSFTLCTLLFLVIFYVFTKSCSRYSFKKFYPLFIIYIIASTSYALLEFTRFISYFSFPTAPKIFIILLFLGGCAFAVTKGMESIIRGHIIIVPIMVLLLLILYAVNIKNVDTTNLFPVFGNGARGFLKSLSYIWIYLDAFLLFGIKEFFVGENFGASGRKAVLTGSILNILTLLFLNLTASYPFSASIRFPFYQLLRSGGTILRPDTIYVLFLTLCGMLYVSFGLFLTTKLLGRVLKTKVSRPYTFSVSLIVLYLALLIGGIK